MLNTLRFCGHRDDFTMSAVERAMAAEAYDKTVMRRIVSAGSVVLVINSNCEDETLIRVAHTAAYEAAIETARHYRWTTTQFVTLCGGNFLPFSALSQNLGFDEFDGEWGGLSVEKLDGRGFRQIRLFVWTETSEMMDDVMSRYSELLTMPDAAVDP